MDDERHEEERVQTALATPTPGPAPDRGWLESAYREHARAVVQAAYRVTGNADDAEDVLHTVFLRLARRTHPPDLSRGARPYLLRAATNAALDLVQSAAARTSTAMDDAPLAASEDHRATPEHLQHARDLRRTLRAALAGLNRRAAQMVALRYLEGLDNQQIAEAFGTSPGTVAVTLHRARARLADDLRPHLGGIR